MADERQLNEISSLVEQGPWAVLAEILRRHGKKLDEIQDGVNRLLEASGKAEPGCP